jgi:hypothetical protein
MLCYPARFVGKHDRQKWDGHDIGFSSVNPFWSWGPIHLGCIKVIFCALSRQAIFALEPIAIFQSGRLTFFDDNYL